MTIFCPACETPAPEEDRFCEICGAELPLAPASDATPVDPALLCPKCQARPEEIDHEGFCSGCGFRREERGRDHLETAISPGLAGVTDRGLRHYRNEDYVVLREWEGGAILVVCDGVSSSQQPDLAAAVAAERACLALEESHHSGGPLGEGEMDAALSAGQASVASLPFVGANAPATTIVAAAFSGSSIVIGWHGDSRAYWIDESGAKAITRDHSQQPSEEQPLRANAHAVTEWLGADAPSGTAPHLVTFQPSGPGRLLLCSDGFWNYAPDPVTVFELVNSVDGDALSVAQRLVEYARTKGGNDNITAAVLTVGGATS